MRIIHLEDGRKEYAMRLMILNGTVVYTSENFVYKIPESTIKLFDQKGIKYKELTDNFKDKLPDKVPKSKKKIFIICPVRNVSEEVKAKIAAYVASLESKGRKVYWPDRDNPHQNTDNIGVQICSYNRKKMLEADEVHIWYDKTSSGSIFDLGMFFMIVHLERHKKFVFVIVNKEDVKLTTHKSFENVLLYWRAWQKLDPDFSKGV